MTIFSPDCDGWAKALQEVKTADLFYSQRFARVFPDSKLFFIKFKEEGFGIFPFLIQGGSLCSFRYGGILFNRKYSGSGVAVNKALKDFCKSRGLRCVVIRRHPFIPVFTQGQIIKKEPFVFIDLGRGIRMIKKGISHGHLACIKKSQQAGLRVHYSTNAAYFKLFFEFYKSLMLKKTGIPADLHYFRRFYSCLKDDLTFAVVKEKDNVVAVSMMLKDKKNVFLAYGGMSNAGYERFAKHFMIYRLISDLKHEGFEKLILGTGHEPYDPIYRFKRGFVDKDNFILTYEKKY